MPIRRLPLLFAIALHPGPADARDSAGLPGSAEFRLKMLSWRIDPPPPPAAIPVEPRATVLPPISSAFGARRDPMRGASRWHSGIDIPGAPGTAVTASTAGVVSRAGPAGDYGNMVEIDHGNGLRTRYAHLLRILVETGDHVPGGGMIGRMGSTGRSTGPHLHFEVRREGVAVDPRVYLAEAPAVRRAKVPSAPAPVLSAFARTRLADAECPVCKEKGLTR